MRVALSSAAAPSAPLGELLEAAARRGLAAVELVEGHGHGLEPYASHTGHAVDAAREATEAGVGLAGFRLAGTRPDATAAHAASLVRFARALDAPMIMPLTAAVRIAPDLRREGVAALALLPSGPELDGELDGLDALPEDVPLAWVADPSLGDVAGQGGRILTRARGRLRHIVLKGGGPEATEQEGRAVGSLMTRLAVAGYAGTVALAPSSERYRVIWDAWLGRRGGWGCGSRSEDRSLVTLGRDG